MTDYSRWAGGGDPRRLPTSAITNSTVWDRRDLARMAEDMDAFGEAIEDLGDFTPTGTQLLKDVWMALFKVAPEVAGADEIRPDHAINRTVIETLLGLSEYLDLHRYTKGDPITASHAAAELKSTCEELVDRERTRQQESDDVQAKFDELVKALAELAETETALAENLEESWDPKDDEDREAREALVAARDEAKAAADELEAEAQAMAASLGMGLETDRAGIRSALVQAVGEAADAADAEDMLGQACGFEPGQLMRMPAAERLAWGRKFNTEHFRDVAKRFGKFRLELNTEQRRKTDLIPADIVGIEFGNDLSRVLPNELIRMTDPDMEMSFWVDFLQDGLLQYKVEGTERLGQGGIILCEDGSGSMAGLPELQAKGIMLALLHFARRENRQFHLLHFGSSYELYPFDFVEPSDFTPERIFEAAEYFCGGGTDFKRPLNAAIERLQDEHQRTGRTSGDILFLTDGKASLDDRWLEWFREEQARLEFSVYAIAIGHAKAETAVASCKALRDISDGKVCTVNDLLTCRDIRDIFRAI